MAGRARRTRRPGRAADEPPTGPEQEPDDPGDPEAVARTICLRLLTHRARSRAELADALVRLYSKAGAARRDEDDAAFVIEPLAACV